MIPSASEGLERVAEYLQTIWREFLHVSEVRVEDSFFARGGDSMQVIRMLVAVSSSFDLELDYDRFIAVPTIAVLAELIVDAGSKKEQNRGASGGPER